MNSCNWRFCDRNLLNFPVSNDIFTFLEAQLLEDLTAPFSPLPNVICLYILSAGCKFLETLDWGFNLISLNSTVFYSYLNIEKTEGTHGLHFVDRGCRLSPQAHVIRSMLIINIHITSRNENSLRGDGIKENVVLVVFFFYIKNIKWILRSISPLDKHSTLSLELVLYVQHWSRAHSHICR